MSDFVVPKREIKIRLKVAKVVDAIVKALGELPKPDLDEMRTNPELIKYVCNLVENAIKKKYKPDKKSIVLQMLQRLLPNLSEPEKAQIKNVIDFLHLNGDIEKVKWIKWLGIHAINF